jgi:Flp pilus assembly protein TadD
MRPFVVLRVAAGLALLLACAGCSTFSGARLYSSGSRALDQGDVVTAIADLEQAGRLLPDSSEVQNHLGIAYEAAGREDAALGAWRRAVALDCGNEAALRNLRSAEGRFEPALAPAAGAASR